MVLVAGDDRDIHRLDNWAMCFAGAINPVGERLKHSGPLIILLPLEVLLDEPVGKSLWIIRRCDGRNGERYQQKKCGNVLNDIPPYFKINAATAARNSANVIHFSR